MPTFKSMEIGGGYMRDRFVKCRDLVGSAVNRLLASGLEPQQITVYDPQQAVDGHWGTMEVVVWEISDRFLVGYEKDNPGHFWMYRKRNRNQPAGGEQNPTYPLYPSSLSRDVDYNELQSALERQQPA